MTPEITNAVPLPCKRSSTRKPGITYPFARMAVGDSFYVETSPYAVRAAAGRWRDGWSETGWSFTTRTEGTGIRVWRTR